MSIWKWIKSLFVLPDDRRCTTCGKEFWRLEWGGRLHITSRGATYIHPIDYVMTMRSKTFAEKRAAMAELEQMDRLAAKWKREHKERV